MNRMFLFAALGAMALLGACVKAPLTELPPLESAALQPAPTVITDVKSTATAEIGGRTGLASRNWTGSDFYVRQVKVNVPESLKVSEANLYLPRADIVWREDPYGDRRAQVRRIIEMAASQAVIGMEGAAPVIMEIDLKRFHALSQKARATVGGRHSIDFDVTLRNAETGAVVVDTFPVNIRLKAYGGQKAIEAEMRGETQKLRISREITSVLRGYLGS